MNNSTPLVFSRLYLPQPLPTSQVAAFLTRLASDRNAAAVVLETRADEDGIQHLIGCEATFVHQLRRILTDLIPGTIMTGLDSYTRPTMIATGHLALKPPVLPLNSDDPERVMRAVYSALARPLHAGEAVCLQIVLGNGSSPRVVPPIIPDPTASLWQTLTRGHLDAPHELRNRVRDRAGHHALECVVRIGATAGNAEKRKRLVMELLSGLSVAASAGMRLKLVRENPNHLNLLPRIRDGVHQLSVPELVTVSAWPLGPDPLPGMPPAHPKLLRAEASVHTGDRVFAASMVPGDSRRLGVSADDGLFHGYALGPTGVGKTSALHHLMEADIAAGRAVLVLDVKDQTAAHLLARIPRERWKDVYVIDGTEANPLGFDPLDSVGRDPDVVADKVLAVFSKVFADGWGPRTADIFSASLRTLTRSSSQTRPNTLVDLPKLWTDPVFRRSRVGAIKDDVALMGFWAWYEGLSPQAQANVIAAPMNKLRQVLLRPAAVKILGQHRPSFRLADLFRERKIVIVPLNEALIGPLTAELIGSLVIAETWQAVQERSGEKDHHKHPGFVYVDEADRFMNLPIKLTDALARSRSLSVGWFLATQFWDQLPKDMKSAVKSNARTKVVFRLESDDDAHTLAKMAPGLTAEDFMSLGKYEIYLRAVAGGVTTNWALAKTLPASTPFSDPDEVRRVSREAHPPANAWEVPEGLLDEPEPELPEIAPPIGPIGRRRRTP